GHLALFAEGARYGVIEEIQGVPPRPRQVVEGAVGVVGVPTVGVERQQRAGGQLDRCTDVGGAAVHGGDGQPAARRVEVVGQHVAAAPRVLEESVAVSHGRRRGGRTREADRGCVAPGAQGGGRGGGEGGGS